MCIFSRTVNSVRNTQIYGRLTGTGTQHLVYSMRFAATQETAMILPIPVANRNETTAVRFISLETYPDFFGDMVRGFVALDPTRKEDCYSIDAASASLEVHQVGDYEASFVPTLADFHRLDERFRLPTSVWESLPSQYREYGFAVFKLRPTAKDQDIDVHPMAFEFMTALPDTLFFPTVHVHYGQVRETAHFEHLLYYQGDDQEHPVPSYCFGDTPDSLQEINVYHSDGQANSFLDIERTQGIVTAQEHCHALSLWGRLPNTDTLIPKRIF